MAGSLTTTTFTGMQVGSDQSYDTRAVLDLATKSALLTAGAGQIALSTGSIRFTGAGTLDVAGATLLKSVDTTDPPNSAFMTAGEISFVSHSGNSIHLAYLSGATVYYWLNSDVST